MKMPRCENAALIDVDSTSKKTLAKIKVPSHGSGGGEPPGMNRELTAL